MRLSPARFSRPLGPSLASFFVACVCILNIFSPLGSFISRHFYYGSLFYHSHVSCMRLRRRRIDVRFMAALSDIGLIVNPAIVLPCSAADKSLNSNEFRPIN